MNKSVLLFLFLIFFITGCSFETRFYIVNRSNEVISISYETIGYSSEHPFMSEPIIVEKINKNISPYNAVRIHTENMFSCHLKPDEALFIGKDFNFTLSNKNEAKILGSNLKALKIQKGKKIVLETKGEEVIQYFEQAEYSEVHLNIK